MASAILLLLGGALLAAAAASVVRAAPAANETATWSPVVIIDVVDLIPRHYDKDTCQSNEYYDPNTTECEDCKTYSDVCDSDYECCGAQFLGCRDYNSGGGIRTCVCSKKGMEWDDEYKLCVVDYGGGSNFKFMTAAQVALGVALVIAVAALAALTCKMCAHRRRLDEATRFQRDSGHASLNSVQLFVLGRMRDRPPRYDDVPDKPPEYEDPAEVAARPLPRIPVPATRVRLARPRRMQAPGPAAPPAYENAQPTEGADGTTPEDATPNNQEVPSDDPRPTSSRDDPEKDKLPEEQGTENPGFVPDNACHI